MMTCYKKIITPLFVVLILWVAFLFIPKPEGTHKEPMKQEWSFKSLFGTFDRAALQRGFQVFQEVCSACHSAKLIYYRHLSALGFSPAEIKALAAKYDVVDGPNDEGEMFHRPGKPTDRLHQPFANEKAARAANNGAFPPDLSLITKAREKGEDYVYSLLIGYSEAPSGFILMDGMHYNEYFPGKQIAMTQALHPDMVSYADGTKATVHQMAHDVVTFLAWASDPTMESRKQMGVKVLLYLLVLTIFMFALMRHIWGKLKD